MLSLFERLHLSSQKRLQRYPTALRIKGTPLAAIVLFCQRSMFQQLLTDLSGYLTDKMVVIEGTYSSVKDQSFVDFLIHMGKPKLFG